MESVNLGIAYIQVNFWRITYSEKKKREETKVHEVV